MSGLQEVVGRHGALGKGLNLFDSVPVGTDLAAPDATDGDTRDACAVCDSIVVEAMKGHVFCEVHTILYAWRTADVKPIRAPGAVHCLEASVHDAYMAKRIVKRQIPGARLRPLYQRTFIKAWRDYREMSQEELAEKVGEYLMENEISEKGYSYASIGRIENGRMPYSQPIIEGIAKALGVSVATLIAIPPPKPGDPLPPDPETLLRVWSEGAKARRQ